MEKPNLSTLSIQEIRAIVKTKYGGDKVHSSLVEKGLAHNELNSKIKLTNLGEKVRQYITSR
jgi:hypothetical protein